jgi:ketosteroid isomerase-like protein
MLEGSSEHNRMLVIAVADEEANAISLGDAERYFAILSEDAVFMPPNSTPKAGDELRQWLRGFLNEVSVEYLNSAHGQTVVANDLAYHEYTCSWKVTPRSGGETTTAHFKGLHIVRRQSDGSWKLSRNIWNLSPVAAAPQ